MLQPALAVTEMLHRNQVESVFIALPAVAQAPKRGNFGEQNLLAEPDCLGRCALESGPASFDLDEGDEVASPNDQIQIVPPQAKPMGLDIPPARDQIGHGGALAPETQHVPPVLPLCGGNEVTGSQHARW